MAYNPIRQNIASITGSGGLQQQGKRDRSYVGDLSKKAYNAQRTNINQGMRQASMDFDKNVKLTVDDIEFAQQQAAESVKMYQDHMRQQWQTLLKNMNREKQAAIKDLKERGADAAYQDRIQGITDLATGLLNTGLTFAPMIAQARQVMPTMTGALQTGKLAQGNDMLRKSVEPLYQQTPGPLPELGQMSYQQYGDLLPGVYSKPTYSPSQVMPQTPFDGPVPGQGSSFLQSYIDRYY
jgi:hypothetical protein